MSHVEIAHDGTVAILTMHREKVHAINEAVANELRAALDRLRTDSSVRALVLTGHGHFFSFGLDVPELYDYPKERFTDFLTTFTNVYVAIYGYPKPVIAAINGHAIAGGCMLAIACDRRLMAEGKGKISLNEITFGATVFAGSTEILRALVGQRRAEQIMMQGTMYNAHQAYEIGIVDRISKPDALMSEALNEAHELGERESAVYVSMKRLLRGPVIETIHLRESQSINEFVDIWYSESTRKQLKGIIIRE